MTVSSGGAVSAAPGSRFMSSAACGRAADRKRWRGLPVYASPELLITGVFS